MYHIRVVIVLCLGYSVALYDDQTRDFHMQQNPGMYDGSKGAEWEVMEPDTPRFTDTAEAMFDTSDGEETAGLLKNTGQSDTSGFR